MVKKRGGGFVNKVNNIDGGFTISERSTIENAVGGSGGDVFKGNGASNDFTGNGGNDIFHVSKGTNTFRGGDDTDTVIFPKKRRNYKIIKQTSTQWKFVGRGKKFRKKVGKSILMDIENIKFKGRGITFSLNSIRPNIDLT